MDRGNEHEVLGNPIPEPGEIEFNFSIDPVAARCLSADAVLKARLDAKAKMMAHIPGFSGITQTEAYVLGDSPLVTLTSLVPPFQPDPSSSRYQAMPTPEIRADGTYVALAGGRPMRVYTDIDADLTVRDMLAKFRTLRSGHP